MNEAESERLAGRLVQHGHRLVAKAQAADIVIINSCSVRESAENRVLGLVRNLTGATPVRGRKIIVTGCMLYHSEKWLKRKLPQVDEFIKIEDLIHHSIRQPADIIHNSKIKALVPIMQGCNQFCTYCVVPYSRGRETSRDFEEIVSEVEMLAQQGYKQITLLGQNVNSYQPSFAKLLRRLHEIKGLEKISFMTSNPWDLTVEIIEAMKLPKIDRTLHLPVQSGDDELLKRMNRPYTVKKYLRLVKKIRQEIPDIKISTDIIVGFPGETKKAFENTIKLCKKIGFVKAYVARYSARPGTAAFKMKDDVSAQKKKRRWQILDKLINQS